MLEARSLATNASSLVEVCGVDYKYGENLNPLTVQVLSVAVLVPWAKSFWQSFRPDVTYQSRNKIKYNKIQ